MRRSAALLLGACAAGLLAAACATPNADPAMTSSSRASAPAGEWRDLFDGRTTAGWRGFRQRGMPGGWEVIDGALTRTGSGGDIVTVDQFANFELAVEWKVEPGGNSGIFYRAAESTDRIFESAPEMQVLDDARHRDGQSPLTSAGANYGLYPAPRGIVKPAGEWNAARVVVRGAHVEHWLNGTKVVEYELGSPDWEARVRGSKFAQWPQYGRAPRGHIGLQDHGDRVAFRHIRIRELP